MHLFGYKGYKLHAVCSMGGVSKSFDLTKALYMIFITLKHKREFDNCTIIGNKGYLSVDYQLGLFESKR